MYRLLLVLPLAACVSPSPQFAGVSPVVLERDGLTFSVFQRAEAVQVFRTGLSSPGGSPAVQAMMVDAAEEATGCAVREGSVEGDSGVLNMIVDCPAI